jgi:hypothetical protein
MNKITLKNSFHNTETTVIVRADDAAEAWFEIQAAAYEEPSYGPAHRRLARVRSKLCGCHECKCGVVRG